MAVYTQVSGEQMTLFIERYDLGALVSFHGIAEGVENENELQYLLTAGCYEFQGYHFFRPMAVEDLNELLKGQRSPK